MLFIDLSIFFVKAAEKMPICFPVCEKIISFAR